MFRRTAVVLAAALTAGLSAGVASAQEYQPDRFDGRSIAGWSYEAVLSGRYPTWVLADGSSVRDGANCSVAVAEGPADASGERWMAFFASLDEESLSAVFRHRGVLIEPGIRREIMSVQGRPAIQILSTGAAAGGPRMDFLTQMVSGGDLAVIFTCTVAAGRRQERLPAFERFLDGVAILTSPAR